MPDVDALAYATLERWRLHPVAMIREEFGIALEPWQEEAVNAYNTKQRLALVACKGPGKTAILALCILHFLATRPDPRIAVTSITGDTLASTLWPELAKWMARSKFMTATFQWTKTAVTHRKYPATWWAQARTWPKKANAEEQAHSLAGLHEDYAMGVLDESSEIPQAVMATVEAILGSGIDVKVLQAGNPTRLDGPLYRAVVEEADLWHTIRITGDPDDPKRARRVSLEWARQQIKTYGRDNPWVMVNVLGMFPPSSINSLLGVEEVEAAMGRTITTDAYEWSQKRLGVDVARFGDDRTVLFPRQGLYAGRPVTMRHAKTTAIAARVMQAMERWKHELTLIDDTGHWGHGVIDNLEEARLPVHPVVFHDKAIDPRYKNRRAEMWIKMAEWVRKGGRLPNLPEMKRELTSPTYTFVGGQFMLEDKAQIKERIGVSPDLADALALTFALPDMPKDVVRRLRRRDKAATHFDPYASSGEAVEGRAEIDFDPFAQ